MQPPPHLPPPHALLTCVRRLHLNHIWTLSRRVIQEMRAFLALWHRKANRKELDRMLSIMPLHPPHSHEAELRPRAQIQMGQEAYLFEKNLPLAKAPAVSLV